MVWYTGSTIYRKTIQERRGKRVICNTGRSRQHNETQEHGLNTIGNEEQVQIIRAGQTINKAGHTKAGREESDTRRHE